MKKDITKDPVFKNIKGFIENNKNKRIMEKCYSLIRDKYNNRKFDDSLAKLDNDKFDEMFPLISAVIFTANKFECDSLNYMALHEEKGKVYKREDRIHIFDNQDMHSPVAYILKISSSYVLHLLANETGSNTPGGSADLVRYISNNKEINPTCIISFGICYGRDPEGQSIGDVLIPKKLYPWSIGQKIVDDKLSIKHDDFNLLLAEKFNENDMYYSINEYCNGEDGRTLEKEFKFGKTKYRFTIKVKYGNMSTGEAVVSSKDFKAKISKANRNEKEIGGEMEGYGLAKECIYYAHIPCVIIKAICDWGELKDIKKAFKKAGVVCPDNLKDMLQAYSAFCAAIILLDILTTQEKRFLSLSIFKWFKTNGPFSKKQYVLRKDVEKGIGEFFGDDSKADIIFEQFLKHKKLILVKRDYETKKYYRIKEG